MGSTKFTTPVTRFAVVRPVAPIADLLWGSGVSACGTAGRLRAQGATRGDVIVPTESDSEPGRLRV